MNRFFSALFVLLFVLCSAPFVAPEPVEVFAQSSYTISRSGEYNIYRQQRSIQRTTVMQRRTVSYSYSTGYQSGSYVRSAAPTESGTRELYGIVYDEITEEPVANAYVGITDSSGRFVIPPGRNGQVQYNPVRTDAFGNYSIDLVPGSYSISVSKNSPELYFPTASGVASPRFVDQSDNNAGSLGNLFYLGFDHFRVDLPMTDEPVVNPREQLILGEAGIQTQCTIPPIIHGVSPLPNTTIYDPTPTIRFYIVPGDPTIPGIDPRCIVLRVNDEVVEPAIRPWGTGYEVVYTTATPVDPGTMNVSIEGCDINPDPNVAIREFQFFVEPGDAVYAAADVYPDLLAERLDEIRILPATGIGLGYIAAGVLLLAGVLVFFLPKKKENSEDISK